MTELEPKHIPSLEQLLGESPALELSAQLGREFCVDYYREVLAVFRDQLVAGKQNKSGSPGGKQFRDDAEASTVVAEQVHERVAQKSRQEFEPSLKPVFNLTGTVIHTNLGRAQLPAASIAAMNSVASSANTLEFDIDSGKRGDRDAHVEDWLCRLTGAEAATVVNNNAAAVLLVLNTLALQKQVAVSRGELVEIGGSFRVPAIMEKAGCLLREVGTTNRTHLHDYKDAIADGAHVVMKVHTSNYRIEGFTAEVDNKQLAELTAKNEAVFINDLGSGALVDLTQFGLPAEPTAREAISEGADVVTFSGDKLLGGPQCGLIVGKKALIAEIRSNPMKRALRCDKLTLAALEAMLKLYASPQRLGCEVPALRILSRPVGEITDTAKKIVKPLEAFFAGQVLVTTANCESQVGSGALPIETLPSCSVIIKPLCTSSADPVITETGIARRLRALPIPVIGRVNNGALHLDVRCLEDEAAFVSNLESVNLLSAIPGSGD